MIKTGRNATVRRDPCGLYAIDSKAIWRDQNDTFVFPHQCEQVYTIDISSIGISLWIVITFVG